MYLTSVVFFLLTKKQWNIVEMCKVSTGQSLIKLSYFPNIFKFINFGEHKAPRFLWRGGRGVVMLNYETKGLKLATFADPFIQYKRHSSFARYTATTEMPHLLGEKPFLKLLMENAWIILAKYHIYIYIYTHTHTHNWWKDDGDGKNPKEKEK